MPKIPKSRSSAKPNARPIPINYSSIQTCLTSRPDSTAEDWLVDGDQQEQQGERYQFGAKAQNHYTNAIQSYATSNHLAPSFTAHYNAARVFLLLSTDFLSATDAFDANVMAVEGFLKAMELAENDFDRCEAGFNYAQSLAELYSIEGEGILGWCSKDASGRLRRENKCYQAEARASAAFEQVEAMQSVDIERGLRLSHAALAGGEDDVDMNADERRERQQMLEQFTSPPALLDTKLSHLAHLALVLDRQSAQHSSHQSTVFDGMECSTKLHEAMACAGTLSFSDTPEYAAQMLELQLLQLQLTPALPGSPLKSTEEVVMMYRQLVAQQADNPAVLSQYADYIYEYADVTAHPEGHALLDRANALISDPFKPKGGVPRHAIPALRSTNRTAKSLFELADHCRQRRPSVPLAEMQSSWLKTWETALEAVQLVGFGKGVPQVIGSVAQGNLQIALVDPKISPSARLDWRSEKAYLSATLHLIRCAVSYARIAGPSPRMSRDLELQDVGLAINLAQGLQRVMERDLKQELLQLIADGSEDKVDSTEPGREAQAWTVIMVGLFDSSEQGI